MRSPKSYSALRGFRGAGQEGTTAVIDVSLQLLTVAAALLKFTVLVL